MVDVGSQKAQVKYGSTVIYGFHKPRSNKDKNRTDAQKANEENLSRGKKNGYMSKKTKSKIKTYIDHLLFLEQYAKANDMKKVCQLGFLTLTLPSQQNHTDKFIKGKMLKLFIEDLKRIYDVRCCLWVAEAQKNGNIHFHILIDKFLDNRTCVKDKQGNIIEQRSPEDANYQAITKLWNLKIAKYDYVNQYYANQRAKGNEPEINPNTVDIHALKDKNNVKAYLCKYLTKTDEENTQSRKIEGLLWGCSDNLRNMKNFEETFGVDLQNAILDMKNNCPEKISTIFIVNSSEVIKGEQALEEQKQQDPDTKVFCEVHSYNQNTFWKYVSQDFKNRFISFYADLFESIYNPEPAMADPQKKQSTPLNTLKI